MGKITVKHYLEKKVKPTMIYGEVIAYPVYVRITVNRKTTQLRSLTGALMSEAAFDSYKKTGVVDFQESMYDDTVNWNITLFDEPGLIQLCIKTITLQDEDYDFSDRHTREQLRLLLTSAREAFINSGWVREPYADLETEALISAFNQDTSLINSIKHFQDVLHVDIINHIPHEYFKMWQVVELVKCLDIKERPFVEFINMDHRKKMKEASKIQKCRDYCFISDYHNITDDEIDAIATYLEDMYLVRLK